MTSSRRYVRFGLIAPPLLAIVVDILGFTLVYPVMTLLFTVGAKTSFFPDISPALSHFLLGLGYLLYPLFMFFGASFLGDLSDLWGRKKVIVLCMVGICLSFCLMGLGVMVHSLSLLFIGRSLSGLLAGSKPTAQAAIADLSSKENKALNLSLATFASTFGVVLGPAIAGFFADKRIAPFFGLPTPFFVAALLAIVAAVWNFFSFKETFVGRREGKIHPLRPIHIVKEACAHKFVRYLALALIMNQLGFGLYLQCQLVTLRVEFHYGPLLLGLFNVALGAGTAVAVGGVIPFLPQRWRLGRVAIISFLLLGVSVLAAAIAANEVALWLLIVPVGVFVMLVFAAMLASLSNAVHEEKQGWVMGVAGASVAIAFTLSGFAMNLLTVMNARWLVGIGGLCQIIGALVIIVMTRYHRLAELEASLKE